MSDGPSTYKKQLLYSEMHLRMKTRKELRFAALVPWQVAKPRLPRMVQPPVSLERIGYRIKAWICGVLGLVVDESSHARVAVKPLDPRGVAGDYGLVYYTYLGVGAGWRNWYITPVLCVHFVHVDVPTR